MQQQDVGSAAKFYANLVEIADQCGDVGNRNSHSAQSPEAAVAQIGPTAQHADTASGHAGAAAAEGTLPFKPIKFSQPVVLDPNTSMMTLPPRAAADLPAVAEPGGAAGSAGTHRSSSRAAATAKHSRHLDLTIQPSRYQRRHASSNGVAAHPTGPSASGASSKRPIERSNVGFQLLQKAGWQEGMGLGAQEQGIAAPLQAMRSKGNTGLGFGPQQQQGSAQLTTAGSGQTQDKPPAAVGPVLGGKRVAALVAAELAAEDLDTKVKRHRQVMQQEAKDKRDKAIQQYLYRAFNDTSDFGAGDNNPLGKNHRLTATNPLLD